MRKPVGLRSLSAPPLVSDASARDPFISGSSIGSVTQPPDDVEAAPHMECSFAERHYTVAEIAAMWNLSKDAVRRMFQNEPGVLVLGDRSSGRKRRYTTLRIPQSVLGSVHRKYEVGY